MKELSLNILDIAKNSVSAGAELICIDVLESGNQLTIVIGDNGCGMDPEFLAQVTDPFATTRTTRKVGMGIPLMKMAAEMAGGSFEIQSTPGAGTTVTARFDRYSIDLPPLGDLAGSVTTLIQGSPDTDFVLTRRRDSEEYLFDTRQIREIMGGIPLNEPEILQWMQEYIEENESLLANAG